MTEELFTAFLWVVSSGDAWIEKDRGATLNEMKRRGCSVIFVNAQEQVLLYLRDDKPGLAEAGKWDLIGGQVEKGESPNDAILREILEEIAIKVGEISSFLCDVRPFKQYAFPDREEYVFWGALDFGVDQLLLFEGQRLSWFSRVQLDTLQIGFGFDAVLNEFFEQRPFR